VRLSRSTPSQLVRGMTGGFVLTKVMLSRKARTFVRTKTDPAVQISRRQSPKAFSPRNG